MSPERLPSLPTRQRGAALITGLLIMMIMTLIGIAAMESSIVQTNLATNSQLNAIGFQASEETLAKAANYTYLAASIGNANGATLPAQKQQIPLNTSNQKTVDVTPTGTVIFCGTLRPDLTKGLSLDANQSANNNAYTRYVFDLTATANVGGQASTRHTQRSSRLMLTSPDNMGLCNI